jgi:hypothetical protein
MSLQAGKSNVIFRLHRSMSLPVGKLNVISHLNYPSCQPVEKLCVKMFLRRSFVVAVEL